jgi:hypothetical protein
MNNETLVETKQSYIKTGDTEENGHPIKENSSIPFDVTTMLILAIFGIIVKLFLSGGKSEDGSTGPASATVWGYGLSSVALVGILLCSFSLTNRKTIDMSPLQALIKIFRSSLPIVATLAVLCWIIVINSKFMKKINSGKVAPDFEKFSLFSTILIIFQLLIVFKFILGKLGITFAPKDNEKAKSLEEAFTSELSSIVIVLTLINLIFAGMLQVVAEFFSTDG